MVDVSLRAARNALIIEGLKRTGTLAGASRHAGCDPRTVKRLIDADPKAAMAFMEGIEGRHKRRVATAFDRSYAADNAVHHAEVRVTEAAQALTRDFVDMHHGAIKDAERNIEDLDGERRKLRSRRTAARRRLREAQKSARALGIDADP